MDQFAVDVLLQFLMTPQIRFENVLANALADVAPGFRQSYEAIARSAYLVLTHADKPITHFLDMRTDPERLRAELEHKLTRYGVIGREPASQ